MYLALNLLLNAYIDFCDRLILINFFMDKMHIVGMDSLPLQTLWGQSIILRGGGGGGLGYLKESAQRMLVQMRCHIETWYTNTVFPRI